MLQHGAARDSPSHGNDRRWDAAIRRIHKYVPCNQFSLSKRWARQEWQKKQCCNRVPTRDPAVSARCCGAKSNRHKEHSPAEREGKDPEQNKPNPRFYGRRRHVFLLLAAGNALCTSDQRVCLGLFIPENAAKERARGKVKRASFRFASAACAGRRMGAGLVASLLSSIRCRPGEKDRPRRVFNITVLVA